MGAFQKSVADWSKKNAHYHIFPYISIYVLFTLKFSKFEWFQRWRSPISLVFRIPSGNYPSCRDGSSGRLLQFRQGAKCTAAVASARPWCPVNRRPSETSRNSGSRGNVLWMGGTTVFVHPSSWTPGNIFYRLGMQSDWQFLEGSRCISIHVSNRTQNEDPMSLLASSGVWGLQPWNSLENRWNAADGI